MFTMQEYKEAFEYWVNNPWEMLIYFLVIAAMCGVIVYIVCYSKNGRD